MQRYDSTKIGPRQHIFFCHFARTYFFFIILCALISDLSLLCALICLISLTRLLFFEQHFEVLDQAFVCFIVLCALLCLFIVVVDW